MHSIARAGSGMVEKEVDSRRLAMDEPRRLHRAQNRIEVRAPDQHVHVLGVSHGGRVDGRDPRGDRVASRDGVRHAGAGERVAGFDESLTNLFHSIDHALEDINPELTVICHAQS